MSLDPFDSSGAAFLGVAGMFQLFPSLCIYGGLLLKQRNPPSPCLTGLGAIYLVYAAFQ